MLTFGLLKGGWLVIGSDNWKNLKRLENSYRCFPGDSVGKETYNAGNLDLIPGSGRSPGEGTGNPLQYSYLANPMDKEAWWSTVWGGPKESYTTERLTHKGELIFRFCVIKLNSSTGIKPERVTAQLLILGSREELYINSCWSNLVGKCFWLKDV